MHDELVCGHIIFVEANKLDVQNQGTQTLLVASYTFFHEDDHVESHIYVHLINLQIMNLAVRVKRT
jgi:hypothetical protein